MGNLGMSNFLTSMLEGMNRAQQSQAELEGRKEKLKFEQDKLKLQEREMEMKYKENPFESLTKQLDLGYKAAQTEKAQFELMEAERKSQEAQALRGLQLKAGEDIAKKVEYYRTQGIKPRGAQLDELMNLYRITGDSPTEIQTTLETQGFIPRYKPESPKEEKKDPEDVFAQKYVADYMGGMGGFQIRNLPPDQLEGAVEKIAEEGRKVYRTTLKGGKKGSTPTPQSKKSAPEKPRFVIKGVK